ncbi:MAG: GMC family oxidoreductase [Silicimonas sp.]
MILSHDDLSRSAQPGTVIIGSGPAGITVALRLAEKGIPSLILEAGGLEFSDASQDFYRGDVIGDPYYDLDTTRLRYFGGSSNHWAGRCRPLSAIDFEARAWVPHSGWPIGRADLDPYQARADDMLGLARTEEQALSSELLEVSYSNPEPLNFAEAYGDRFRTSDLMHLAPDCAVQSLEARDGQVRRVLAKAPDGTDIALSVERVIVATGGIENARLLSWSNVVSPQRVVAEEASLGRYWMEHPHHTIGEVAIPAPIHSYEDIWFAGAVAPSDAAQERYGIANASLFWFLPPNLPPYEDLRSRIAGAFCSAAAPVVQKLEALTGHKTCMAKTLAVWEQYPVPENRVALSESGRDEFGVPRVELHWKKGGDDFRTAKVIAELFGRYLYSSGKGMLRVAHGIVEDTGFLPTDWPGGHHHLGGTRMSDDPKTGVVDANLRIHGMRNAYVVGSSVFPTGGYANPTYTIVQLALRLGDHLAGQQGA